MEDSETFSPEFLEAEVELLSYSATLRATADEIETTVAGYRAFVSEHAEASA
jgi:hypothetical protein